MKPASDDQKDELLPDRHPAVLDGLGLNVGARQGVADRADARAQSRQRTKHFPEDDAPVRARLLDEAGRRERRRDVGDATDDRRFPELRRQLGGAIHAVLQRQNRCVGADHRRDARQRRRVVVRLDRDNHHVDRTDPARIFFGAGPHREVTEHRAADLEAALPHRRQMRAARDERDVMTGAGELRAVIAADGTRTED